MDKILTENFSPLLFAFWGGVFTFLLTAIGSSTVFIFKKITSKISDSILGLSGGIMLAASVFSLLLPSIEISKKQSPLFFLPPILGFLLGAFFLKLLDNLLPHIHINNEKSEGVKTNLNKKILLMIAITLHNIPEGLAIGVSFGSITEKSFALLIPSLVLTLGIGLQNIPEGAAISFPLRGMGLSRTKSFLLGALSAIVEPVFSFLGAFIVSFFSTILPYALSFSAGAMIYVVVEEVIPESQSNGNVDLATISTMMGFAIMMLLDIIFNG
ncbi:MAG: ZIP family metal transporter [candidate division WOR-3 bacterium]